MKKILLVALILASGIQSFAAWKSAMLRLKHEMGRSISISVDGRKYTKIGRSLTVGDLPPGNHKIKIYKYNSNGYGYTTGTLIYQGMLKMRPGRIYYGVVSNDGSLDLEENCCIDDYGRWNNNDNWDNMDQMNNTSNEDHGDNWNNNHSWNQQHHQENHNENGWGSFNGQMSDGRFTQLTGQIRKASFETSKVSVANQALKTNKITCQQLLSILNEFSFESTKLQFAKDAYKSVTDKNNYFMINDVFAFQSSKDDLLEFLDRIH
jgi:hypothetical protein